MCKKEAAGDQPQIELETDAIGKVGATPKTETTVPNARRGSDWAIKDAYAKFEWEGVKYSVKTKKGPKEILKGIDGGLGGGELCAIMGPSGSGKTSLLNVLAGRIRGATVGYPKVEGRIEYNGKKIGGAAFRKRIAYVMQQDLLVATQTPREAIMFSAMLRLPKNVSMEEKRALTERMLTDLGLEDCADTFIGDEMIRGISGGQKKRTSVGIELVMKPTLVFLDEPTSGLDAFAAYAVIKNLGNLAAHGCNVLCTIHQPSSEVFHLFSRVLTLHEGATLYFGPTAQLSARLGACGHACPNDYNPADFVMFLVQTESAEEVEKLRSGLLSHGTGLETRGGAAAADDGEWSGAKVSKASRTAGFCMQLYLLTKREVQTFTRNKPNLLASILVPCVLNLFFALIFLHAGRLDSENYSVTTHYGSMTQIAIGAMFNSAQPLLLKFPLERGIFLREYATNTYGSVPYFLSKTMVELPQSFMTCSLTWLVAYWLIGLHGPIIEYILITWLLGAACASTALLIACLAANPDVAIQMAPVRPRPSDRHLMLSCSLPHRAPRLAPTPTSPRLAAPPSRPQVILVPQIMFSGFFIKSTQIPIWLRWAQVPYSRLPHPPHLIATPHLQRPGSAGRSTSARSSLR
jgi:ABC-type multidrug transport system ATPase subunit